MTDFPTHTIDTAPEASKPILENATATFGFVPNPHGLMASAPALLEAYVTLSENFNKTNLSETERQIILMTNNRLNGSNYCMAAHTTISQIAKVSIDVTEALRTNTPIADPKLEALHTFAAVIHETRGWPTQAQVDAFLAAGYTRQTVLEVILGNSLEVMSNYTNHVAETKLDDIYAPNAWAPDMTEEEHAQHRKYAKKRYRTVEFWRGRTA